MGNLLVKLPDDLHYKIKIAAMEDGMKLQDWVTRSFLEVLAQRKKSEEE